MTDKKHVIQIIEELAVLLELKGANPFKIRAFQNAARSLQNLDADIGELVRSGKLTGIKGIGKSIADLIGEILSTGKSSDLERLKDEIPPGVTEMLKIPGMGAKKVKAVWEKLGITTIGELEYACKENRLVDLEGFGAKTQEKILSGIDLLRKYSDRHLLSKTLPAAEKLVEQLCDHRAVVRCEITGELRRFCETIRQIDILVSAEFQQARFVVEYFCALPEVDYAPEKTLDSALIVLESGIKARLRVVDEKQFALALLHSTGSAAHLKKLQQLAAETGVEIGEKVLPEINSGNHSFASEPVIYQKLNLQFIEPELREDRGEIEAARQNRLPHLVTPDNLKGVIHVHTRYSDGANTIAEMARACKKQGYQYLVVSDHSKTAVYANGLSEEHILEQHREIEQLNAEMENFTILKSIECDILPDGSLDYSDSVLTSFDLVIGSIHSKLKMSPEEATRRILRAMENPYLTILGHPTGRLLLAREGYPVDMHRIIEAAAELGVAIELNANPHRLDIDWRLLREATERGVKISINPDAHRVDGINDIRYGIGIARKGWLSANDVLNCLSAQELTTFAKKRRNQ